jgi:succinate dehydrogenase / fumarate reductase membrane anchor subunit
VRNGGIDYALWKALFGDGAFKLATFLFMVSLLYHAWIGARDIDMDCRKPVGIRLTLELLPVAVLIAYLGWTSCGTCCRGARSRRTRHCVRC